MFLEELIKLATETSTAVIILLVVGVVFCFIEAIVPSFGFWGVTGILSTIAGIVLHAIVSGSALQVLFILLILALIFVLIALIFIRSAKYGLLAKLSLVENKTALPANFESESESNYQHLLGKIGVTVTECRPVGKVDIEGEIYEASSKNVFLSSNVEVFVTEISQNSIYIEMNHKKGDL
jgi:membrane-bound serine protease (ClpP class)